MTRSLTDALTELACLHPGDALAQFQARAKTLTGKTISQTEARHFLDLAATPSVQRKYIPWAKRDTRGPGHYGPNG